MIDNSIPETGLHLGRVAFSEMVRSAITNNFNHDTPKSFQVVNG